MKIGTRLTLRYTGFTAAVFLLLVAAIYLFSEQNRSNEFFRDLKKEGITKANLFLDNRVDAKTMQSIYLNNREFINEVEVAIYDTTFHLLYHDAKQIDLVKETPEMIDRILQNKSIEFYQDGYQVIGLLYTFHGTPYVITAAAFDGYGYAKQHSLQTMLIVLFFLGIALLAGVGYLLSRSALAPVSDILGEVEAISASRLDLRVPVKDEKDELGELATTFNRMLERLEQSFDSQKMFVSNVSHELRTPMAALIAELELALLKERSSEEYRRAIGNVLDDSRKLVKLSEGLLNLAKADYLPEQIKLEEIRLDELLLDAREMVMKANPDYTIELIFGEEADDDSVLTVLGNGYLLKTAFVNLMENNCKFSANHTSFVQISFWEQKSVIRFSDTGIGMNADDMQHLFSPFYRGSNKDYARGNGIGMMLTQKIIHTHKGEITVNSQPGEGTVYTVEIPHI
ncbi:sensor histidine kinase [Bacteroides fragilis]|uniref:sensor histidine kinase n=1 Tax=Bacteroides fragilis TaxID=817 RepID=UPI0028123BB6|nr:HAMP domain-containing sensor histidine kinase [Bacteroides fragilis]WMI95875.1 HAMP domain-containing histidine kinase [Bacteroides fragilis]